MATRTFPARGWGTLRNAPSPRWVEGRGGDRERRARQDPPSRSPSRSRGRASEGRRTSRWAAQKGSAQLSSFRRLQGFPLLLRRGERRRGGRRQRTRGAISKTVGGADAGDRGRTSTPCRTPRACCSGDHPGASACTGGRDRLSAASEPTAWRRASSPRVMASRRDSWTGFQSSLLGRTCQNNRARARTETT